MVRHDRTANDVPLARFGRVDEGFGGPAGLFTRQPNGRIFLKRFCATAGVFVARSEWSSNLILFPLETAFWQQAIRDMATRIAGQPIAVAGPGNEQGKWPDDDHDCIL